MARCTRGQGTNAFTAVTYLQRPYTRVQARVVAGRNRLSAYVCCFAPEDLATIRVRHFDGADTWKFLD